MGRYRGDSKIMIEIGNLVRVKDLHDSVGILVDTKQKKCWRTDVGGISVNWDLIEPEPHGIVMLENKMLCIPIVDLEVIKK